MLEAFYQQTKQSEDDAQSILEVLVDIADTEPKFLTQDFERVFSTIWKVNMEERNAEADLQHMGTEIIITLL